VGRILKPGGRLFLYAPLVFPEHQAPHDFFRYTSYGLRHLCGKAGLEVVSVVPSNGPLYTGIRMSYEMLGRVDCSNPVRKLLRSLMKRLFRWFLIPVCDRLDRYVSQNDFPIEWLLVAEKEGPTLRPEWEGAAKREAIASILRCPDCGNDLAALPSSYRCNRCEKEHPVSGGQVDFLSE